MFNFEHTKLTQAQFEHLAQFLIQYKHCYATPKFDHGQNQSRTKPTLKSNSSF